MKGRILEILRGRADVISGEALSARLGVSRVSIWKHLQKLQSCGYRIESTPKGYRLLEAPDALLPWEFPGWEARIHHYEELSSTMDTARQMARDGCEPFTVVVAERQTRGRGRLQRHWVAQTGGIYFTIVLRPPLPPQLGFRVNFAASAVLARVLQRRYALDARVKWPNDVLIEGCKVCGLLAEMETEGDQVSFVNIGIGINANNDPPEVESGAVALHQLLGRPVSRRDLLADFLGELEARIGNRPLDRAVAEWRGCAMTLNRRVRVVTTRESLEGTAVDVDDTGALLLDLDNGVRHRVIYGDCFLA